MSGLSSVPGSRKIKSATSPLIDIREANLLSVIVELGKFVQGMIYIHYNSSDIIINGLLDECSI